MKQSHIIKIFASVLIVIVLAAAIVVGPNLRIFDEDALPEIAKILAEPNQPTTEGNAYYYLYGMAAASDKDPEQVGKAVIQTLQSKHRKGEMANLTDAETIALYGAKQNEDEAWQASLYVVNCIHRTSIDCFEQLQTQLKGKSFTNERFLVQQARYQKIIKLPHMIEDMRQLDFTSPLPNFFSIMKIGELSQAKAYQESGINGLLPSTQADMQFWRMVLTDSQTLIGKMVALAGLRRNLAALSYAIKQTPQLTNEQIQQLQALLKALTPEEISMEKKLIAELRFSVENWQAAPKKIPEGVSVLLWYLSQPMANANWFYRQSLKPALALDKLSPKEFYERAQPPPPALEFSRFNPYNLGGKLSQVRNWQYADYLGRAHDLAGIYSLVSLQLELKTTSTQDIETVIKNTTYKNPYTEKSFDYDPTIQALSFQCFDAKDLCKISL